MRVTRRQFFQAAALAGLTRKSGVRLTGSFVHDSHTLGHRLRDRQLTSSRQPPTRVPLVIVGGGIAGLSAAWRLDQARVSRLRPARDGARRRRQRPLGAQRGQRLSMGGPLRAGAGSARAARARAVRSARRLQGRPMGRAASVSRAAGAAVPSRTLASRVRAAGRADRARSRPRGAIRGAHGGVCGDRRIHRADGRRGRRHAARYGLDGAVVVRRKASIRPGCAGWWTTGAATTTAPAPATRRPGPAIHYFASRAPQRPGPSPGRRATGGSPGACWRSCRRQGEDRADRYARGARGPALGWCPRPRPAGWPTP